MDARYIDNHIEKEIERLENEIDKGGDYRYLSAQVDILNELLNFIEVE